MKCREQCGPILTAPGPSTSSLQTTGNALSLDLSWHTICNWLPLPTLTNLSGKIPVTRSQKNVKPLSRFYLQHTPTHALWTCLCHEKSRLGCKARVTAIKVRRLQDLALVEASWPGAMGESLGFRFRTCLCKLLAPCRVSSGTVFSLRYRVALQHRSARKWQSFATFAWNVGYLELHVAD